MLRLQCSEEELEKAWEEARSIESTKEDDGRMEYIGEIRKRNRIYRFFRSDNGKYWYSTRICTKNQELSEYEAIFGRKKKMV
mgnify:CR=1 FL=1